jgi:hypothetical protein
MSIIQRIVSRTILTSPFAAAYYVPVTRKGVIHKCVAGIPVVSGVDAAGAAGAADAADASVFGNVSGRPPLMVGAFLRLL